MYTAYIDVYFYVLKVCAYWDLCLYLFTICAKYLSCAEDSKGCRSAVWEIFLYTLLRNSTAGAVSIRNGVADWRRESRVIVFVVCGGINIVVVGIIV